MKLSFRQGLISGSAYMLTPSISRSDYISLDASVTPLYITIAHGTSDYLLKFDSLVEAAWGPIQPLKDSVLYVEIETLTGETVFGIADHEPMISATEPDQAPPGKMWFDLSRPVMKVRSPDGTRWTDKPRCIIGAVINGSMNQIYARGFGSAVGLNTSSNPGYIIFDIAARPIRTSTGEFLTSETNVRLKTASTQSASLVNPVSNFVPVRAAELIPEMGLVYLSGPDRVSLATSSPELSTERAPIGIVQQLTGPNEDTIMAISGEIAWPNWSWAAESYGKPLYCGLAGELTLERPKSIQVFRVGRVKNKNTILFAIDSETETQVISTDKTIIEGVLPISVQATTTQLGENVSLISLAEASTSTDGYISSAVYTRLETSADRADTAFQAVTHLEESKADIGHSHSVAEISGLTAAIADIIHTVDTSIKPVIGATKDNFVSFGDGGYIQDSGIAPTDFAVLTHHHVISDIDNLEDTIAGFATSGHLHGYLDILGLSDALDERAFNQHTHAMINITGLVPALDERALKDHVHVISEIGDANILFDEKISFDNNVIFEPQNDYNPAHKKYVDDAVSGVTEAATTVTTAVADLLMSIDGKLSVDNTAEYEPTSFYNPAHKKYVDEGISNAVQPILQNASSLLNRVDNLETRVDEISQAGGSSVVVTSSAAPIYSLRKDPPITDIGSASHHNGYFIFLNSTDLTLTVAPDSQWTGTETYTSSILTDLNSAAMPVGGWIVIGKRGSGNIIFDAGSGVQINCAQTPRLDVVHTKMTLVKTDVDEWDLILNNF